MTGGALSYGTVEDGLEDWRGSPESPRGTRRLPWRDPGSILVMEGLPRPKRAQVCRRGVPGMGQRLQDAVQLCHLGGRELPVSRSGVGDDLLRGGGTGNDAAHLGMCQ